MTKAIIKTSGLVLLAAVLAVFASYATMRLGWWTPDLASVRAKWAGPPSVFMSVDGVKMHVRDEGHGPAVVMLHGSIANLHEWDPVADRLKNQYRIIRMDWPPYGVSGPDPTRVYSTKRAADLVSGVIEQLGLRDFVLVSTSNGANVALQYAADHPEHIRAMAFSILPLERPSQTRRVDPLLIWLGKFHERWLPDYHSKFWYWLVLKDTTSPGFKPPATLVDSMYDMNNLPGAVEHQHEYIASNTKLFRSRDVGAIAERVHVPVLLQWCDLDTVISQSAQASVARFTHAPVELVEYKDVGHFPMWEAPDRFTADLRRFLDRVTDPRHGL